MVKCFNLNITQRWFGHFFFRGWIYEMIGAVCVTSTSIVGLSRFWRCCHSLIDWFIRLSKSSSLIVGPSSLMLNWRFVVWLLFTLVVLLLLLPALLLFTCKCLWLWWWWALLPPCVQSERRQGFCINIRFFSFKMILSNDIQHLISMKWIWSSN